MSGGFSAFTAVRSLGALRAIGEVADVRSAFLAEDAARVALVNDLYSGPASAVYGSAGKISAEGRSSQGRALCELCDKVGQLKGATVAKLIKHNKVELRLFLKDPHGLRRGGSMPWFKNEVHVYGGRDPKQAAGVVAHETKHFLRNLTPSAYGRIHEYEAYKWQSRVDSSFTISADADIWNLINSSRFYRNVP